MCLRRRSNVTRKFMKIVTIEKLGEECSNRIEGLQLHTEADVAFELLRSKNPTNNAYSEPMSCLGWTLAWVWLEWHRTKDMTAIAEAAAFVVRRVRDVSRLAMNEGLRRLHDVMLLQCAILSGDRELMQEAAGMAGRYDPVSAQHAYEWGLVEVYRGAIQTDAKAMRTGHALMESGRPCPPYRMPAKAVVAAFVASDDKTFGQALKRVWARDWEILEKKEKGMLERSEAQVRISLRQRTSDVLWPWPEAAFAKLAVMRGTGTPSDPLWCPAEFQRWFRS